MIDKVNHYCSKEGLAINVNKTSNMVNEETKDIIITVEKISHLQSVEYLGLTVAFKEKVSDVQQRVTIYSRAILNPVCKAK